jgi:hypothetical protein
VTWRRHSRKTGTSLRVPPYNCLNVAGIRERDMIGCPRFSLRYSTRLIAAFNSSKVIAPG